MGGKDRPWQVFRQGDKPGVFILKVLEGSGAARSERLKPGDRILKVRELLGMVCELDKWVVGGMDV